MKRLFLSMVVLNFVAYAAPEIENLSVSRNAGTGLVTLSYDLTEEAIVTAEVYDNGEKLPQALYGNLAGGVHRVMPEGTGHQVWWKPPAGLSATVEVKLSAWAKDDPPDYLAVGLVSTNCWRFYATAEDVPGGVTNRQYKGDKLLMRKIYAKDITWPMGVSSDATLGNYKHKLHYVTLDYNYYIGVYEVTQQQYRNAAAWYLISSYYFNSPYDTNRVVEAGREVVPIAVSFNVMRGTTTEGYRWPTDGHTVKVGTKSTKGSGTGAGSGVGCFRNRTGLPFDLTTEAEWEYACRAGEASSLYSGKSLNDGNLGDLGWFKSNWNGDTSISDNSSHEVGLKLPNKWGLYDMLGNGWEICLDVMTNDDKGKDTNQLDPYQGEDCTNPLGPTAENGAASAAAGFTDLVSNDNGRHARRGGGYTEANAICTAAARRNINHSAGYEVNAFRFAIPAIIP